MINTPTTGVYLELFYLILICDFNAHRPMSDLFIIIRSLQCLTVSDW